MGIIANAQGGVVKKGNVYTYDINYSLMHKMLDEVATVYSTNGG